MNLRPASAVCLPALLSSLCLVLSAQEVGPPPPGAVADPQKGLPTPKPAESWAAEARPVPLSQTPGQVRVFEGEDLTRSGARTLGEFLLKEMPAQVQNQGGPGLPSRTFIGGNRPQDSIVLLDGMPLSDPGRLGPDLNEIPLLGITRVEVITGSPGAGSGGQGGTIALFTGKPEKRGASGDLSGLGGNNGKGSSEVTPGFGWEGGYLRGGNLSAEEKQTTTTDRPYRQVTNFFGVGHTWGAASWSLGWRGTRFGVPEPYQDFTNNGSRVYNPTRESRQQSDSGQLRVDWALGPIVSLETTFGMARFLHDQPDDGAFAPTHFEGRESKAQVALHLKAGPRSGVSVRLENTQSRQDGDEDPAVLGSAKGRQGAFGFEWFVEPVPGFRILSQVRGTQDRQTLIQNGTETSILKGSGHTLRLGFNQSLPGGLRLYAAGGGGRTAPPLLQQLRNANVPGAAPLGMERTTFMQLGLGWAKGNWFGKIEGQQQDHRDLVGSTTVNGLNAYANQDHVRVRGLESGFGWTKARKLGVEAFVRAQEARDMNAPEGQQFVTPAVQRRPFTAHGLKALLGVGAVDVQIHYTLQGHQYASIGDCDCANPVPTIRATRVVYRDVGMVATAKVGRHWTLIWRGEHLIQPKVDPKEWVTGSKDGQNDAFVVYGYPAARPTYSFEARFHY